MSKPKTWLSWSSGKDSAWTLYELRRRGEVEVVALLTTVNSAYARVAMHATREALVEAQAAAAGLPLIKVAIPPVCTNIMYEQAMATVMARAREEGVAQVAFGDLFLEDVRRYREEKMAATGINPIFPLWGRPTRALAEEMIASGLRAIVTCVDPRKLDASFAGRTFDAQLLADLPAGADPCGENGEFHSFVFAGPMFARPLDVVPGEVVTRDGFVFADVNFRAARVGAL